MIYKNLIALIGKFSSGLDVERSDKFGWLTNNLEILGTGICCKAILKLKQPIERIEKTVEKSKVKIASINATEVENEQIVILTSQPSFGLSEFECCKSFYGNVKEMLETLEETNNENGDEQNEINSQEAREVANETEVSAGARQEVEEEKNQESPPPLEDIPNEAENNEQIIDENHDDNGENAQNPNENAAESTEDNKNEENEQNEQTMSADENNEGKLATNEKIANPFESNNANENNTDNLAEGEKVDGGDKAENNETITNETNQETDAADKPNNTEDAKEEAEVPATEG